VAQVQADLRRRILRAFVGRGLLGARPPFAMDRLRKEGNVLGYRCAKQHSEPGSDKRGAKADELHRTPLEPLIPLVNSEFLSVDRPGTALLRARRGFLRGLRALPRGDTRPHGVDMPIRRSSRRWEATAVSYGLT
jgi:hypothetical protein